MNIGITITSRKNWEIGKTVFCKLHKVGKKRMGTTRRKRQSSKNLLPGKKRYTNNFLWQYNNQNAGAESGQSAKTCRQ